MAKDWKRIEAFLQSAYDFQTIPTIKERDIKIIDVWNATELCINDHNYLFIGSRGSGKSTLIDISIQKIKEDNMKFDKEATLFCKMRSHDIFKSIEQEYTETDLGRFIQVLFKSVFDSFESIKKEKIKSSYIANLISTLKFKRAINKFDVSFTVSTSAKSKIIRSIRSKIAEEFGSASFALLDAAFVSFGKITFAPLSISYKSTEKSAKNTNKLNVPPRDIDNKQSSSKKSVEQVLDKNTLLLLNIISTKAIKNYIKKCIIFIDDFHFLPLHFQINFFQLLWFISQHLTGNGIITAFKVFSSHDTTIDIASVLGFFQKEFTSRQLEATLEKIDVKRRALESLLIRVLCAEDRFKESDVQNYFTRETIDSLVILSGGHPRRFLQMASRFIYKSKGERSENVHHFLMLSAAEIINESRRFLGVQLGVEQGIALERYRSWYQNTISNLVKWVISGKKRHFFFIPCHQLREDLELKEWQWLEDAIAIGDILEIEAERIIHGKAYRLIAINPATIYDIMGSFEEPILQYSDVVGIQRGSYRIDNLDTLGISGEKIIFFFPSEGEYDYFKTKKYVNISKMITDFKSLANKICKKFKDSGFECKFTTDQTIAIRYGNKKTVTHNRSDFKEPFGLILTDGRKKPKVIYGIKNDDVLMDKIKSFFRLS